MFGECSSRLRLLVAFGFALVSSVAPFGFGPVYAAAPTELIIYEASQRTTYSNFNWNGPNDNYAWRWAPVANGIPNQIKLYTHHITGVPTGRVCIRATTDRQSKSYGCSEEISLKQGENSIPLTGATEPVTWEGGKMYYVHFTRTSDANNYPSFEYRYPTQDQPLYRSSGANGDPNIHWFSYDIAMVISAVPEALPPVVYTPAALQLHSQAQNGTYSNFNWNEAGDRYAWAFEAHETGVPSQIILETEYVTGSPTGDICIRSGQASDSESFGCAQNIVFRGGENIALLTNAKPIVKGSAYFIHFKRTSDKNNAPAFRYVWLESGYPMYRASGPNTDPTITWFKASVKMEVRGTAPTTPIAAPDLVYGMTRVEAEQVYNQLSTTPRSLGFIQAGMSNIVLPGRTIFEAKINPSYYYKYFFLVPERAKSSYTGYVDPQLVVTYDELGATLGKPPRDPWMASADAPVDTRGYLYGVPRDNVDAVYHLLKSGSTLSSSPYITAGYSDIFTSNDCVNEIVPFHRAWNGFYRYGNTTANNWKMMTRSEASAHGMYDFTYEEAKNSCRIPYRFLMPGYIAALGTTSATGGLITNAVAVASSELPTYIPFSALETALGYPASGITTPNLVYVYPPVPNLSPIASAQQTASEPTTTSNSTPSTGSVVVPDSTSASSPSIVASPELVPLPLMKAPKMTDSRSLWRRFLGYQYDYLVGTVAVVAPSIVEGNMALNELAQATIRDTLIAELPPAMDRVLEQSERLRLHLSAAYDITSSASISALQNIAASLTEQAIYGKISSQEIGHQASEIAAQLHVALRTDQKQQLSNAVMQSAGILQKIRSTNALQVVDDSIKAIMEAKDKPLGEKPLGQLQVDLLMLREIAKSQEDILGALSLINEFPRAGAASETNSFFRAQEESYKPFISPHALTLGEYGVLRTLADLQALIGSESVSISPSSIGLRTKIYGDLIGYPVGIIDGIALPTAGQNSNGVLESNLQWGISLVSAALDIVEVGKFVKAVSKDFIATTITKAIGEVKNSLLGGTLVRAIETNGVTNQAWIDAISMLPKLLEAEQ